MNFYRQEQFFPGYIANAGQDIDRNFSAQAQGFTNFDAQYQSYQQEHQHTLNHQQENITPEGHIYNEYHGRFQPYFGFSDTVQEPLELAGTAETITAPVPDPTTAPASAPSVASPGPVKDRKKPKAPKSRPRKAKAPPKTSILSTNASLSRAFKVRTIIRPCVRRRNGEPTVYRSRKLVPVDSSETEAYRGNMVEMSEDELPAIACPVAGCTQLVGGRKMLEEHLCAGCDEGGHEFVINKSGGQERVACVAGRCEEAEGQRGIAEGGMTRHLVEHHTNVWIYCVACNFSSPREFNVWKHFKEEHDSLRTPARMREIVHENL